MKRRITFIGAGEIGTTIGEILARLGNLVYLWDLRPERRNTDKTLEEIVKEAELIFLTVPSGALTPVLLSIKDFLRPETKIVSLAKGMDKTGKTVPELIQEVVANDFALMAGPMLAEELALGLPGFSVVAGEPKLFEELKELFLGSTIRLEYCPELRTVAYAGILKNVYALIFGLTEGLGQGDNTRGFLVIEVLKEWEELAKILALESSVLRGLAGQGDLIATSFSRYSRNRQLGESLVKGDLKGLTSEGLESLGPLLRLVRERNNQSLPRFLDALERIVIKKDDPKRVFQELIT